MPECVHVFLRTWYQVHILESGATHIYSRNAEDHTAKYPDLIAMFPTARKADPGGPGVRSCILDGEVVAFDRETQQILPFQVLSTRARKVRMCVAW